MRECYLLFLSFSGSPFLIVVVVRLKVYIALGDKGRWRNVTSLKDQLERPNRHQLVATVTYQVGIGNVRIPVGVGRVDGQGDAVGKDGQQDQILERCAQSVKDFINYS